MEIKKKELLVCPDCGCRLEFKYAYKDERTGEDRTVYYCPEGDEDYYFEVREQNGEKYLFCICLWDKTPTCYGLASQLDS